jgi:hypothetical protein
MMAAEEAERLKDITQYPDTVSGRHMTESIYGELYQSDRTR